MTVASKRTKLSIANAKTHEYNLPNKEGSQGEREKAGRKKEVQGERDEVRETGFAADRVY
jgi:hypothetical protein